MLVLVSDEKILIVSLKSIQLFVFSFIMKSSFSFRPNEETGRGDQDQLLHGL